MYNFLEKFVSITSFLLHNNLKDFYKIAEIML